MDRHCTHNHSHVCKYKPFFRINWQYLWSAYWFWINCEHTRHATYIFNFVITIFFEKEKKRREKNYVFIYNIFFSLCELFTFYYSFFYFFQLLIIIIFFVENLLISMWNSRSVTKQGPSLSLVFLFLGNRNNYCLVER